MNSEYYEKPLDLECSACKLAIIDNLTTRIGGDGGGASVLKCDSGKGN